VCIWKLHRVDVVGMMLMGVSEEKNKHWLYNDLETSEFFGLMCLIRIVNAHSSSSYNV